jgi:hypothetical protein
VAAPARWWLARVAQQNAAPGADEQDGCGGQEVVGDARHDEKRADLAGRREMWTRVG